MHSQENILLKKAAEPKDSQNDVFANQLAITLRMIAQKDSLRIPSEKLLPQHVCNFLKPESPLITSLYIFHNQKRDHKIEESIKKLMSEKRIFMFKSRN